MSGNKQVTKVIVYYSDGTFEEIAKNPLWPVTNTPAYNPLRCMVCGELHGEGIQCPGLRVTAYSAGQEDPGQ